MQIVRMMMVMVALSTIPQCAQGAYRNDPDQGIEEIERMLGGSMPTALDLSRAELMCKDRILKGKAYVYTSWIRSGANGYIKQFVIKNKEGVTIDRIRLLANRAGDVLAYVASEKRSVKLGRWTQ